jgi:uncharacterized membrane protein
MFGLQDLFQWDRFITPTIIKTFYWLAIGLVLLMGLSGIFSGLAVMAASPFGGFVMVLVSLAGILLGVVFARIAAELVLIVFRINEHLGAIRHDRGL